jgi:hypothetical protein
MPLIRRHLARRALLAALPQHGAPGRTSYRTAGLAPPFDDAVFDDETRNAARRAASASPTGTVLFVSATSVVLASPPFAVEGNADAPFVDTAQLVELLDRKRVCAVFLLRLGGFSVGFFRGDALVDSKTDQRFVKNRNRKGGQSQRRFERIREKQIDELFAKACETARDRLTPYEREIQHVFLGGDRHTLQAFRKQCAFFDSFGGRLMSRVLPVHGDPRKAVLEAMPREIWSSDVWTYETGVAPEAAT